MHLCSPICAGVQLAVRQSLVYAWTHAVLLRLGNYLSSCSVAGTMPSSERGPNRLDRLGRRLWRDDQGLAKRGLTPFPFSANEG